MHPKVEKYYELKNEYITLAIALKEEEQKSEFLGHNTQNLYIFKGKRHGLLKEIVYLARELIQHYESYDTAFIEDLGNQELINELYPFVKSGKLHPDYQIGQKKHSSWRR